jgi:hypothetical protein
MPRSRSSSGGRNRVTEHVHIKVERWKKGARKPETDEIIIKRIRSTTGPPAESIQELAERVFRPFSNGQKAIPAKPKTPPKEE